MLFLQKYKIWEWNVIIGRKDDGLKSKSTYLLLPSVKTDGNSKAFFISHHN